MTLFKISDTTHLYEDAQNYTNKSIQKKYRRTIEKLKLRKDGFL